MERHLKLIWIVAHLSVKVLEFFVRSLRRILHAAAFAYSTRNWFCVDPSGGRWATPTKRMLQRSFTPTDLTNELVLLRLGVK
jgi:hypothetical protein